jgi:hypothetical protein
MALLALDLLAVAVAGGFDVVIIRPTRRCLRVSSPCYALEPTEQGLRASKISVELCAALGDVSMRLRRANAMKGHNEIFFTTPIFVSV